MNELEAGAPQPLPEWYNSNNIVTENCHGAYPIDARHVRLECSVGERGAAVTATTPGTGTEGLNLKIDVVRPLETGTAVHVSTFDLDDAVGIFARETGDVLQPHTSKTFAFDRHHHLPYNYDYTGTRIVIRSDFAAAGNVALIVHP